MSQDLWFIDRLETWRAGEYRWVPQGEVIVVAGAEGELSSGFEGKGTVAVQLNFIASFRTFRQHLRAKQQHGLDKSGLYFGGQTSLSTQVRLARCPSTFSRGAAPIVRLTRNP
jgi:hypothetical protein